MHFGEFLVKQKILSPLHVLKALAEQSRRRQSIPLLLVEQGSLADYEALKFCTQADQSNEDFLEVLLREGYISQQQCTQIRKTWMRSGPPLGLLLVELGMIDETTRQEALAEFELTRAPEEAITQEAMPQGRQGTTMVVD